MIPIAAVKKYFFLGCFVTPHQSSEPGACGDERQRTLKPRLFLTTAVIAL